MSTRRLAIAIWAFAILVAALWWPISYRYSLGVVAVGPKVFSLSSSHRSSAVGVALTSGVGKAIVYFSWSSGFTRRGFICEPVLAHEFPHPWLGFQLEGGRLWISFPIGAAVAFVMIGAFFHLRSGRGRRGVT